jgi:hypothetical protein
MGMRKRRLDERTALEAAAEYWAPRFCAVSGTGKAWNVLDGPRFRVLHDDTWRTGIVRDKATGTVYRTLQIAVHHISDK